MDVVLAVGGGVIFLARLTYWLFRIRQDDDDAAAAEARRRGVSA
jgi:hypothetical protein